MLSSIYDSSPYTPLAMMGGTSCVYFIVICLQDTSEAAVTCLSKADGRGVVEFEERNVQYYNAQET